MAVVSKLTPPHSDEQYFRQPTRPSAQLSDNWVLRFSSLKRLYRLITQFFADVLHQPTSSLDVPDLQAVAKDHNEAATLILCRLTIAIAVQSERNKDVIDRIQKLSEAKQHILMKAIEQVRACAGYKRISLTSTPLKRSCRSSRVPQVIDIQVIIA